MVARQYEHQVDIAWIMFAGHETPIHDDGTDQAGRMDPGHPLPQGLVEAGAAIRRLKGSEACTNVL